MKTPNHSKTLIKPLIIAIGLASAVAASAWGAELPDAVAGASAGNAATDRAVDPESAARANWRKLMTQNSAPATGCFHASYPSLLWEKVACKTGQPRVHPTHIEPTDGAPETVGGTGSDTGIVNNDWVAHATGLITQAIGGFYTSNVTSENGVGVPQNGDGGILGPNEYSIQLNTNDLESTSACAGHNGCHVWQQFIYATDYSGPGEAEVFMQYWLLHWELQCTTSVTTNCCHYGAFCCPNSGWTQWNTTTNIVNCYANSFRSPAPDVPITDLENLTLEGSATAGGIDTVALSYYDSEVYSTGFPDYVLDISSVWNKAEFNVLGNGDGSRADFNRGASITVQLDLLDGSTSAPNCLANGGTTGESNNLNAGACTSSGGAIPYIQFTESN
jgi:hypothetical protein